MFIFQVVIFHLVFIPRHSSWCDKRTYAVCLYHIWEIKLYFWNFYLLWKFIFCLCMFFSIKNRIDDNSKKNWKGDKGNDKLCIFEFYAVWNTLYIDWTVFSVCWKNGRKTSMQIINKTILFVWKMLSHSYFLLYSNAVACLSVNGSFTMCTYFRSIFAYMCRIMLMKTP